MSETGHYSTTADAVAKAILSGLSALAMVDGGPAAGGTGCVRSMSRIENDGDPEDIERGLDAGLPGYLVCFKGGTFEPEDTSGQRFRESMNFRILCCVGVTRTGDERFAGGQLNPDAATMPGVEELQDWAIYFGCRGARTGSARFIAPAQRSQAHTVKPGLLAAAVDLVVERVVDVYDDALTTTLLSIGICHNPTNYEDLFEADNITPKSDWPPPGVDGGVAEL